MFTPFETEVMGGGQWCDGAMVQWFEIMEAMKCTSG